MKFFLARLLALPLLAFPVVLAFSSPAYSANIYTATVVPPQASLYVLQDGKMAPVANVTQGTSLQVTDLSQNGWRQVVIRQPGQAARWGWVTESQILVSSSPAPQTSQVSTTPNRARARAYKKGADSTNNDTFIFAGSVGYGYEVEAGLGNLAFGGDLGLKLVGNRGGALFLDVYGTMMSASGAIFSAGSTTSGVSVSLITLMGGLTGRNLFGSGLYAGGLAGVTLLSTTVAVSGSAPVSGMVPLIALGAVVGYEIRPAEFLSLGPEILYYDVYFGGADIVQGQAFLRFHL